MRVQSDNSSSKIVCSDPEKDLKNNRCWAHVKISGMEKGKKGPTHFQALLPCDLAKDFFLRLAEQEQKSEIQVQSLGVGEISSKHSFWQVFQSITLTSAAAITDLFNKGIGRE